jgi:hypothetical protein
MQYQLQRQAKPNAPAPSPPPQINAPEVEADARKNDCHRNDACPERSLNQPLNKFASAVNLLSLLLPHTALNVLELKPGIVPI